MSLENHKTDSKISQWLIHCWWSLDQAAQDSCTGWCYPKELICPRIFPQPAGSGKFLYSMSPQELVVGALSCPRRSAFSWFCRKLREKSTLKLKPVCECPPAYSYVVVTAASDNLQDTLQWGTRTAKVSKPPFEATISPCKSLSPPCPKFRQLNIHGTLPGAVLAAKQSKQSFVQAQLLPDDRGLTVAPLW